jgi:hypothetical protein
MNRVSILLVLNHPADCQDFVGIMTLLIINSTISFLEENNVGNVATSLMACLAPKTKVNNIIYKTKYPFQGKDTQPKNSSSYNNKRMDRIP